MSQELKRESLERAMSQIEKDHGKGAIMRLGETRATLEISAIPTGSVALDAALGVGGVPRGRIVEIFGPEASGKTTLALNIIAEVQRQGGIAAFIDAENALDPNYAESLGINLTDLLISQPDNGEQALEIADTLIRSSAVDVIAVDSVAALVPKAELEGEMGESFMGLQARLMSQALRKLAGNIHRSNTVAIFINQMRQKIGVMFGNPETTTGGMALKFYASVRIDIRKLDTLKKGEEIIGTHVRARVVKNKVAPPFRSAEFDILFGRGIWKAGDVLDVASAQGLVEKTGVWFAYGGKKLGQGRQAAAEYLDAHPDVLYEMEKALREKLGFTAGPGKKS